MLLVSTYSITLKIEAAALYIQIRIFYLRHVIVAIFQRTRSSRNVDYAPGL